MPARITLRTAAFCLVAMLVFACSGDKDGGGSSARPGAPDATSEPDPRPFDTPAPGTPIASRQITGIFYAPRDARVTKASLGTKPASPFQPGDRRSVILYDTQTSQETNLGPGTVVAPVFSNNRMVYAAEGEAWLVDLATMDKRSLGPASLAYFADDNNVLLIDFQRRNVLVNLTTGDRLLASSLSDTLIREQESATLGGPLRRRLVNDGYVLRYAVDTEKLYALKCRGTPEPESEFCGARFREEFVLEDQQGRVQFQFRALTALPAGKNEFIIATSPMCDDNGKQLWCEEVLAKMEVGSRPGDIRYAKGTTNLFMVDIASGKAKFIATVAYNPPTQIRGYNWPLTADANYVAWTELYCGQERGKTRIFDRKTGQIRELDTTLWVRLGGGMLGIGEFGAKALLDPATLQYRTVLPDNTGDVTWSPDYRYAAVGQAFPHGGLCG